MNKENTLLDTMQRTNYLSYKRIDLTNDSNHIFIACMPKSGSTFFSNALVEITKFDRVSFQLGPIDNHYEQEIYLPAAYHYKNRNTITQQHTRGSKTNFEILKKMNAVILIQTRSIFDACSE